METIKSLFVKPDPREQVRKCNATMRAGVRKLDRDIANLKNIESKTKSMILSAERRANRDPSQAKLARKEQVAFAKELIRTRKQHQRLVTSKAQLNSVNMQINEAFATRKIEGSLKSSVVIMKDVNSLVRLPELTGTMRDLSQELMKAGVIEEMVDDMLPEASIEEDEEEAEGEVDKVLDEILQQKMGKVGATPDLPTAKKDEIVEDEEEEDAEAMLDQMRGRLEALKS